MRECGILFPISAIPSSYGIGTFGIESYKFIDFLVESKQKYWQILPLGQTGYGDSPYQTFSFFSGGLYYIDLDFLVEEELLLNEEIIEPIDNDKVDYNFLFNNRISILKKAYKRFKTNKNYDNFILNDWLDEYCIFMSMKEVYKKNWYDIKGFDCNKFKIKFSDLINFYKFVQFKFYEQWFKLKKYANDKNIKIIGDMPIYASFDSSDVFFDKKSYLIEDDIPIKVAGCPADYFSKKGQYWGNPIYNWSYLMKENFSLFKRRFSHNLEMYDKVRIDHFRGLSSYYAINYNDIAVNGKWYDAYGKELFDELKLDKGKIIIEDLGYVTNDVKELIDYTKFDSMKVAIFSTGLDSEHLPCNYEKNITAYTTTHDNLPINGWKKTLTNKERKFFTSYLNCSYVDICDKLVESVYASKANLVIIQLQDILNLDENSSINNPGMLGNWTYRLKKNMINAKIIDKLVNLVIKYNR